MSQLDDKRIASDDSEMAQHDGKRFHTEESKTNYYDDKRINEALEMLDATARDRKLALQSAMENKYFHLTAMLGSITGQLKHRVTEKYESGKQKAVDAAVSVNKSVHKNPWVYVGGAAVGAMLVGFFLGRSRRGDQ
ncbi:MAG: DUF883 C-terminal domain-containing protein [Candidatus Zixiibacteriota bacterium]